MRWEFVQQPGAGAAWRWQCIEHSSGSIVKVSRGTFTTLVECIEDAKQKGYSGPAASGPAQASAFGSAEPPPFKAEKR